MNRFVTSCLLTCNNLCVFTCAPANNWKIVYDLIVSNRNNYLTILFKMFYYRISEDENLEAASPRRCQGRGCSRGLNLDVEKGLAYLAYPTLKCFRYQYLKNACIRRTSFFEGRLCVGKLVVGVGKIAWAFTRTPMFCSICPYCQNNLYLPYYINSNLIPHMFYIFFVFVI